MELTSWLCILGAGPCVALGFITYQGMNAEEIFMTAIYSFLLSKTQLIFQPINIYYETLKPYIESKIKKESESYNKKLRKIKKERKTKNELSKSAQDIINIDVIYEDGIFKIAINLRNHIFLVTLTMRTH